MEQNQVNQMVAAGVADTQIMSMGATAQQIAIAKAGLNPTADATATPVYKHYGESRTDNFGRSRHVKIGDELRLVGTTDATNQNGRVYTRWVFKRRDGSEWTIGEGTAGMWARIYYNQFIGNPEGLFNHLVAQQGADYLKVSDTKMVDSDYENQPKVQGVKF